MMLPRPLATHGWILALIAALAVVFWTANTRATRLDTVSRLGTTTDSQPGLRTGLVPLHAQGSYEWIAQAGLATDAGGWRLREVPYDNATAGRPTALAAPYRRWIQLVAAFDRVIHGHEQARSLERAAVWAGPWLQALFLVGLVPWIARLWGTAAASLLALGWVAFFPLNTLFLPGQPDDLGLKAAIALIHLLALATGVRVAASQPAAARRWFLVAGAWGGFGCWLQISSQLPVIAGVLLAAAVVSWRATGSDSGLPWRCWATAGATVSLLGWLFEYAPSHLLPLRLETNHPLYALAWLGAADGLARLGNVRRSPMHSLLTAAAVLAPVVAAFATDFKGFPGAAANVGQLTGLNEGLVAEHTAAWLARDGFSLPAAAISLLLLAAGIAGWPLLRRAAGETVDRRLAGLLIGPVALWTALAAFQLHAWSLLAAGTLALVVVAVSVAAHLRFLVAAATVVAALPGLWLTWPRGAPDREVTAHEVEALVARDLAHALSRRSGTPGAVVLAPPTLAAALAYYGDLRVVGTTYWENHDGLAAAVRIMGATSADEALALAQRREIRYLVLPSWDSTLEDLARIGAEDFNQTLVGLLRQWLPPRWLRPVPYTLPGISGLETRAVMIFEVVEAQDNPTALARLAEYFLEMGQPHLAVSVAAALKQAFPQELSALAGRLYVEMAQRDTAAVNATVAAIQTQLGLKADEILPWERRVSLALALAQARQTALARPLIDFSLETVDEDHLRSLTPGTLYRLLAVTKALGLAWPDEGVRQSALTLLPPEWRERL